MLAKDQVMKLLYNEDKTKRVSGWWKDSLYDIYECLNKAQEYIRGNLCEIGVYCGRSLLPLANLKRDKEYVLGVDVFENSGYRNIKNSYSSVISLMNDGFDGDNYIKIIKSSSQELMKKETLKRFNPIRLFSIDGDHSFPGTLRDLTIAYSVISPKGIIFLDDYDNPRFKFNVLKAVDSFLDIASDWSIMFASTEKLFLCHKSMVNFYQDSLSILSSQEWETSELDLGSYKNFSSIKMVENIFGRNSWVQKNKSEETCL